MVKSKIKLSTLHCEFCQIERHHRASFLSLFESTSSFLIELVHLDMGGPYYHTFGQWSMYV